VSDPDPRAQGGARPASPPDLPERLRARFREALDRAGRRLGAAGRLAGRAGRRLGRACWRWRRPAVVVAAGLTVTPLVFLFAWAWFAAARVDLGRVLDASVVYARGRALAPGLPVEGIDLPGTLRRLRYREVTRIPWRPGQFRRSADQWEIFLRARDDPDARRPAARVRLAVAGGRITTVVDPADGRTLDGITLEPEVLSGFNSGPGQLWQPVRLTAVPRHLLSAVLAAEDHRFFEHPGVDAWAVLRAVTVNLRQGEVVQGGSTLTQQLVKNLVLNHRRTWDRKIREAALALALERRHGKDRILEAYLNAIYLGQRGPAAVYGLGAATRSYFGKDVEAVSLAEAALLAGMIRAPNSYSPVHSPERARERRDTILHRMRELQLIGEADLAEALRERVRVPRDAPPALLAGYFLDYVRAQIEQEEWNLGQSGGGLRVYTTLDPVLQRVAEGALARGLDRLESRYAHLRRTDAGQRVQGALIALDADTGEIRALVGGRDYGASQFNRAVLARRQPGSAFKPFVYLAALGPGPGGAPPRVTPASLLDDTPLTLRSDRETWSPRNYENRFEGTVTVRRALEQSLNAATVRLALDVGLDAVIHAAREAGFTSPMAPVPALALGSFEVTPLELAGAYAALANGGRRVTPRGVRAVMDRDGTVMPAPADIGTRGLGPDGAFLVTHLLQGVLDRGTGAAVRSLGVEGRVAGKTGTTNDGRDAWFVGYTRHLVTLVWVGFDESDLVRLSGGQAALPIWADFMRSAMTIEPGGAFAVPLSVTFRDVDAANGRLATAYCPLVLREAFLSGTGPREVCEDHGPIQVFDSVFRRFLDLFR
jgi:penicillin-binding protein 1B